MHLFIPRMDFASNAANQDILLEIVVRTRINWQSALLAAEMEVATLRTATPTVDMPTTSTLKQLRTSPLP